MQQDLRYAVPDDVFPELAQVLAYWSELKRGENEMPFADDANLSALGAISQQAMLIEVFGDPMRFRFGPTGRKVIERYGGQLEGEFSDEIAARPPLNDLTLQAVATVQSRRPTHLSGSGYSRLLLPLWGEGHVAMLLGAVAEA